MIRKALPVFVIVFLSACIPVGQIEVSILDPTLTATVTEAVAVPTATNPATQAPTSTTAAIVENAPTNLPASTQIPLTSVPESEGDAILILEPGPGSRLTSPLRVYGAADTTFEQALVVRLVLADGTELAIVPIIIQSPMGERGAFEAMVEFTVSGDEQAFIQVYSASARDGGITHLSSVGVMLAESGAVDIRPPFYPDERIRIDIPALNAQIPPGMVHVQGFALASFEQTLVVELLDENGSVIVSMPVIVQAPDLGMPGDFSVDLELPSGYAGPGRIVVRDPSVVFEGDVHLASVEVWFVEP